MGRESKWMQWDRMCLPKVVGGLGFKKLRHFNLAILDKPGWRFLTYPNALVTKMLQS
ncbi:conserved hypothetical protein [Ricinus communis]|uniref:Uncharacterized protein n=1 Tax=Ricinus communis TaxID=3988 RepID=B9SB05_RICCO|nr:conserved hypothetical protein [Ricinus communis]